MGLLDKNNPKATPKTILMQSITGAVVGAAAFFLLFRPSVREAWKITLPIWVLLCAAIGALMEWQVPPDEPDDDDISEKP
jgi:hypothetical protein